MPTTPEFGTQLIGQTENALGAILERQLADSGMNRSQWITLTVAVMSGGTIEHAQLTSRVAGALKMRADQVQAVIHELVAVQLLSPSSDSDSAVSVTDAGRELHGRIRVAVAEITQRLWGDLSAEDLATAGRVLATVLERANSELAST
jgi:DNA-binding MarR family transcriptional regulator